MAIMSMEKHVSLVESDPKMVFVNKLSVKLKGREIRMYLQVHEKKIKRNWNKV